LNSSSNRDRALEAQDVTGPAGDPAQDPRAADKEPKMAPGAISRRRSLAALPWRDLPWEAIAVGLGLFALLAAFVAADPAGGVTASTSPFTDEGFFTVNARNLVQFGHWSTDEWNLYLVNLPLSVLQAIWFAISGIGIVQARLINIACVSLTAAALVWALRSATSRTTAVFAGLAFATCGLILYYGRLVYLEDLVVLLLALGTLVLAADERLTTRWGALSGLCYAVAIATKASAVVEVVGVVAAVTLIVAWRDPGARRWLVGAVAAMVVAGLVWLAVIWLPNRSAVSLDLKIWAPVKFSITPVEAIKDAARYILRDNDKLFGFLLGPLVLLGGVGLALVAVFHRRLSRAQARLALVSIAWVVFGFGVLLIASYRPNRYVVPIVPPLAILAALGLHVLVQWSTDLTGRRPARRAGGDQAADADAAMSRSGARPMAARVVAALLVVAVTAVAIAPGLQWYSSWASHATYTMPAAQASLADAVPDGQRVAGTESAIFLLRSHAITLLTQRVGGVANDGNLYAQGVRYYLVPAADPAPKGVPDATWAARRLIFCAVYGGVNQCLYRLP
jgi:4-amino-4-deoxy-L-arabinose transferase-like glycosyltransferase